MRVPLRVGQMFQSAAQIVGEIVNVMWLEFLFRECPSPSEPSREVQAKSRVSEGKLRSPGERYKLGRVDELPRVEV